MALILRRGPDGSDAGINMSSDYQPAIARERLLVVTISPPVTRPAYEPEIWFQVPPTGIARLHRGRVAR